MPVGGTSANFSVLFSEAWIASDEVEPDLLAVDVERGDELHVADVVLAELHVHEAGDEVGRVSVLVVLDALDERRCAVAHADDCYAYRTHYCSLMLVEPADAPVSLVVVESVVVESVVSSVSRSCAMSSFSQRTSRSAPSSPCCWSWRV